MEVVAALDDLTPVSVSLLAESFVLGQSMVVVGKKLKKKVRKTGRLVLTSRSILPPCLLSVPPALFPSLPPSLTFSSFILSTASRWEANSSSDKAPSSVSRKCTIQSYKKGGKGGNVSMRSIYCMHLNAISRVAPLLSLPPSLFPSLFTSMNPSNCGGLAEGDCTTTLRPCAPLRRRRKAKTM